MTSVWTGGACSHCYNWGLDVLSTQMHCALYAFRGVGVVIFEMVFGRPPWDYKSSPQQTLEQYFESITQAAAKFAADDAAFSSNQPPISNELRSLLR